VVEGEQAVPLRLCVTPSIGSLRKPLPKMIGYCVPTFATTLYYQVESVSICTCCDSDAHRGTRENAAVDREAVPKNNSSILVPGLLRALYYQVESISICLGTERRPP
jgi:hypothetical protein